MKLTKEGIAVIEGDDYLSADIENAGRLDVAREFLLQFRKYIPEGGVVMDIGACLGDFTATFSEFVGPKGKVHAYEPNPPVFDCLMHNMTDCFNVTAWKLAFGAFTGRATIIEDVHNIGASYLIADKEGAVQIESLDSIAQYFGQLDFIKIDAEGYEPWILDGGIQTLRRLRPVMLIEIDQRALGFQGFKPVDIHTRLDALDYDFPRFDGAHGDILCIPR